MDSVEFANGEVAIATPAGRETVSAAISGDLAVHSALNVDGWAVTHIPTGARIYLANSKLEAFDIARLVTREHADFLAATKRMRFATEPGAAKRLRGRNKELADNLRAALSKARGEVA